MNSWETTSISILNIQCTTNYEGPEELVLESNVNFCIQERTHRKRTIYIIERIEWNSNKFIFVSNIFAFFLLWSLEICYAHVNALIMSWYKSTEGAPVRDAYESFIFHWPFPKNVRSNSSNVRRNCHLVFVENEKKRKQNYGAISVPPVYRFTIFEA